MLPPMVGAPAAGPDPPQESAASQDPPTNVSQAILLPPQSEAPEIIMEVASIITVASSLPAAAADSLTQNPASSVAVGHPSPGERALSASEEQRSAMLSSVHPSPRNSMQVGPDHGLVKEQLPFALAPEACNTRLRCGGWGCFNNEASTDLGLVRPRSMAALWAPLASHSFAYGQRNCEENLARVGCMGGWFGGRPLLRPAEGDSSDAKAGVQDAAARANAKLCVENFILLGRFFCHVFDNIKVSIRYCCFFHSFI
ncbi:unnamed protein product [Pseudo-nitzschia multistriata]|uniref:Uncharacterized protein n=1 Tax=Pseudo-nitzschia multistriata TaxID=183589 RepID=A0A448ZDI1_9STRA|nr:unnamed protein product [Pseudo-nitzschia multistriata]